MEPETVALMRAHAHRLRLQDAALIMMAFHNPKRLGEFIRDTEDPEERQDHQRNDLLKAARAMAARVKKNGNS